MFTSTTIKGETVLYGTVDAVTGIGLEQPAIHLELIDSTQALVCATSQEIAIAIAKRTGQQIGLIGIAEWDVETFDLVSFQASEVSLYVETHISEAVRAISEKYGEAFYNWDGGEFQEED